MHGGYIEVFCIYIPRVTEKSGVFLNKKNVYTLTPYIADHFHSKQGILIHFLPIYSIIRRAGSLFG